MRRFEKILNIIVIVLSAIVAASGLICAVRVMFEGAIFFVTSLPFLMFWTIFIADFYRSRDYEGITDAILNKLKNN